MHGAPAVTAREPPRLGAIVLVGGRSSRMGAPKALLDWHGGALVRRVAGILQRVADPVVVVHADGQELPPLPGVERVVDRAPDRGPLEGMAAGLRAVAGRSPAVFVSGTDLPFLHPDLVLALATARGEHDAAVPVADGHVHHLCAVYGSDLLPAVEHQLACDRLRVSLLLERIDVLRLDATALPHPESLRNLNTDEAYRQALAEPQPRITLPAGPVRAATLGEAFRLAPALAAELSGRTLLLNGAAIESDPATPLVEGDVLGLI
ncbi:MAG TPA: molybdenum cofactor guanylyltransferase [Gaiellales bacterium]|nr:molybdenum cofactor guanylyltransferase [Gaiellales bacterium]